MLCSISTTSKSGSSWLDRLRSNKGFPTDDDSVDLDHFLNKQPNDASNCNTESTQSDDKRVRHRKVATSENGDKDKEWLGVMSNVLSELFNVGESEKSSKKSLRKQTNPKFCVISTSSENVQAEKSFDSVGKDENVQAIAAAAAATATVSLNSDNNPMETNDVEENELFGYSRSEVTVIDTSFSVWKFDKLVFRRKNVWKVRDKKAKSRTVGRKKRKGTTDANVNVNVNVAGNKKAKVSTSDFDQCALPSTHSQNPQDDKKEEVCKETPDDLSQVPDKRSPRKSRKGGSSVILIKDIPTSKNSGARLPKSGFKDSKRKYKA